MTENELKIGDVVQLKSGGPLMTIAEIKSEQLGCVWFSKNDERFA